MYFRCLISAAILAVTNAAASGDTPEFRVCVEPDNLPFSDARGDGFENQIAKVIAEDLGRALVLVPIAQHGPGYFRQTLGSGRCDALLAMPKGADGVLVTAPYYESGWMFVTRSDRKLDITGFDDPRLAALKIGVPVVGSGPDTAPLMALGKRGLIAGLKRYPISGVPGAPVGKRLVQDVVDGRIDLAVVWGPAAGYFAGQDSPAVTLRMTPAVDHGVSFRAAIGMAVAKRNTVLRDALNDSLVRSRAEIAAILAAYHVPVEP
jgi:mxaJ protein